MKTYLKYFVFTVILSLVSFSACDFISPVDVAVSVPDSVFVSVNEMLTLENVDLKITFDSVLTDSRCPLGVQCVWEGNAEIQFDLLLENSVQHIIKLNTNPTFRQDTVIHGVSIRLIELKPYPVYNEEQKYSDYKAKLLITKITD